MRGRSISVYFRPPVLSDALTPELPTVFPATFLLLSLQSEAACSPAVLADRNTETLESTPRPLEAGRTWGSNRLAGEVSVLDSVPGETEKQSHSELQL